MQTKVVAAMMSLGGAVGLLAQVRVDDAQRWNFLLAAGALLATMGLGTLLFYLADRWRKRQLVAEEPGDELTSYRELYDRGELTRAEYDKILSRQADKLKVKHRPQAAQTQAPHLHSPPGPNSPRPASDEQTGSS